MKKSEKDAAVRANFVEIWNASASPREAAERLGMSFQGACSKAWTLRKMWGLEVKKFPNGFAKGHARNSQKPAEPVTEAPAPVEASVPEHEAPPEPNETPVGDEMEGQADPPQDKEEEFQF